MQDTRNPRALWAGSALLAAGLMLAAPAAQAAGALEEVYACAALEDAAARLACYDGAVGRLKTEQSAGEVTVFDREQVAELERRSFGFPKITIPGFGDGEAREGGRQPLQEQEFIVASSTKIANNRYRFIMETGEVWDMSESNSRARLRRNEVNRAVVKRAALGSFMMRLNDSGPLFRVRRVE